MFTSRAEYRLHLRSDNADQRLTPIGRQIGLVDDARWQRFSEKLQRIQAFRAQAIRLSHQGRPLLEQLARPESSIALLAEKLGADPAEVRVRQALEQVLIDAKYQGYVARQQLQIERLHRLEALPIPRDVDYWSMTDLRFEAREKFAALHPVNLGQAGRISGITPADVTVLWVYLTGRRHSRSK
jgi:tRNA uridine 5-carboxymethylaminomethyl modification enzyme